MDKIIVLIGGLIVIGLIVWWFFGKRDQQAVTSERRGEKQIIAITVDGGYSPNVVTLEQNVPAELVFTRKDPSSCLEQVVFPDFGLSKHLPVNEPVTVAFTPTEVGEYKYACGMNMFFGKVIVK
jgi:plastocyanin domain-containing protein